MTVSPDFENFQAVAAASNASPLVARLMSDQLTPVLGYRRLVSADDREAPSFLFESVENGDAVGRHSYIGAQPSVEVIARGHKVTVIDHRTGERTTDTVDDPLDVCREITAAWRIPSHHAGSGLGFTGGWVDRFALDLPRDTHGYGHT